MFAYRFSVNFEDQDGFLREIELDVDQTFMDFRNAILEHLNLPPDAYTSFFLCDHKFRKKREIFHPDFTEFKRNKHAQEIQESGKKSTMDKAALNEFIDDPHQKMVLIFDEKNEWIFYIELVKIVKTKKDDSFPRIVNTVGPVPIELRPRKEILKELNNETTDEETQDDMPDEMDHEEDNEGYDEDDLNDFDDNAFYNDSIDGGKDTDENK